MLSRYRHVLTGVLAGGLTAIAAALVLWGSWMLPALGLLVSRVDLVNGLASVMILGALGGGIFALLSGKRRTPPVGIIMRGVVLCWAMWVIGALIFIPLALGMPVQLHRAFEHLTPLAAFALYGLLTALIYAKLELGQPEMPARYITALLVVALVSARMAWSTDPHALHLKRGYRAEVVATKLTYPTSIAVSQPGTLYIAEAGRVYGPKTAEARIASIDEEGSIEAVADNFNGPINGLAASEEQSLRISPR